MNNLPRSPVGQFRAPLRVHSNLSASYRIPTLAINNVSVFVYDAQRVCAQKRNGEIIPFHETCLLCLSAVGTLAAVMRLLEYGAIGLVTPPHRMCE